MAQSAGNGGNNSYAYTYDADGNRLSAVVTGTNPASQSLTFNAANQITSAGYAYDGAGNLTASPAGTYTDNGAGQMTAFTAGGTTYRYTYAGASQTEVLSETKPGGSGPYQVNLTYGRTDAQGQPEIEQYQVGSGQAYVLDDPVTGRPTMLTTSSDQDGLLVFDGLADPVGILTDANSTAFSYSYDPWGVQTLTGGGTGNAASQNPYTFHGGIKDIATGFVGFLSYRGGIALRRFGGGDATEV